MTKQDNTHIPVACGWMSVERYKRTTKVTIKIQEQPWRDANGINFCLYAPQGLMLLYRVTWMFVKSLRHWRETGIARWNI